VIFTMVGDISTTRSNAWGTWAPRFAAPWILGLYALASAAFIMATRWADWYSGSDASQSLLLPFAAVLGGLTLLAAMWAVEVSDGLATAIFGTWGAFWIADGLLNALFVSGRVARPAGQFPEMGFWFIAVAAITWAAAIAALARSVAAGLTFGLLAAGSTVAAIADIAGRGGLKPIVGWLFILSAIVGWYTATGIMFEEAFHRSVLPLGVHVSSPREWSTSKGVIVADTPAARRAG
jgi:hypothetical protein